MTNVIEQAKLKKLIDPEFTVSLCALAPKLFVLEEATILEMYW